MKKSEIAERDILKILNKNNRDLKWEIFKNWDENGKETFQYKIYKQPYKTSYPDIEGSRSNKLELLVEVKSLIGFFDGRKNALATYQRKMKAYKIVSDYERCPVQIVFAVWNGKSVEYFWQDLSVLRKMPFSRENFLWEFLGSDGKLTSQVEPTIVWDTSSFRTDINNLGKVW